MPIGSDLLDQLRHLLRPLGTRISNMLARGTLELVDDSEKMQRVQVGDVVGGPYPGAENVQPYGFSSVPLVGADTVITIFPNGDRSHPIVLAVGDRRYRPTGGQPGEVTVYNSTGAKIVITQDGDIVATPAAGRHVQIDDGSGAAALPTLAEFNAHTHPAPGGATSAPTTTATGTTVLKAK